MTTTPYRGIPLLLPPNRVWRTYQGGRVLDTLAGVTTARDSHFPEDWIGSVTRAVNPVPSGPDEGLSRVPLGSTEETLAQLIAGDPAYFLGEAHQTCFGAEPRVLVKFIDSAIRLHFQVHPTQAFARQFLGATSGKTEAYYVLAGRKEVEAPCLYLGFHTPPAKVELKRMIETQDMAAIAARMNRMPVEPGDAYLVPGGTPHALGEGLFLVEIQEPSDLVVRFEFERGGYVLPEEARFMGRGLDFCLDVFDPAPCPPERIERELRARPREIRRLGHRAWQEELIGPAMTSSFRLTRTRLEEPATKAEDGFTLCIVTEGGVLLSAEGWSHEARTYETFLLPAGLGPVTFTPRLGETCTILECRPPAPGA